MSEESKSKWKWILGLIVAILTAVLSYLGSGCTSLKNLEVRGTSRVDAKTGVIVQYDTVLNRQIVRSARE